MAASEWDQEFVVMCDASDFAMGAVLGQRKEKIFKAIYYASRTFRAKWVEAVACPRNDTNTVVSF